MTTRHFNYTDRQRIARSDVQIRLEPADSVQAFSAWYKLADYNLPDTAEVVVEAHIGWTVMRFHFGTVGVRTEPRNTELSEFDVLAGVRFRLKVLGTGDNSGLILAEANNLVPSGTDKDHERSFVVVRPADLGPIVWRLSFDESQPVVEVNDKLGDWRGFLRRAGIRSLILPEIVRQVFREAINNEADAGDQQAWQAQARKLAEKLSTSRYPRTEDEEEEWLDNIVHSFAVRHHLWRGVTELFDLEGD